MGDEYHHDQGGDEIEEEIDMAYLKCINVPTMFDIGCSETDPLHPQFELNILDIETWKIEKEQFLNSVNKLKMDKIIKFKPALNAIHINMRVSKIEIRLCPGEEWANLPFSIDSKPIHLDENTDKIVISNI
jgi:hypothetical protein